MQYYFFFISFFLITLCGNQSLLAKTLHAILVADTIHDISSVTRPDLCRWQKEVRTIAIHTNMQLKEKKFSGYDFKQENIKKYLENLSVEQFDTVIFYFSGHGYRTFKKKTPWPFLTFELDKPGLDIHWIIQTIRQKKPQFALIMSDCCNNYMEYGFLGNQTKDILLNLKRFPPQYAGYHQLFCYAKGCIVVSSCSRGQFSYGSHLGGLYTQCFFNSLNRELRENKPSWKSLLQRTNGFIRHIQCPICEVYH